LLESEFFGHKKGSFTGAIADKMGFFEVSNLGTLFLDEIADMPLNLQAKILRAAEEKVITRVGDTKPIRTDFRIISSTNHDIEKRVAESKFRLDLLHRLNTVHIHIPPLRERPEDIKPLLIHFTGQFAQKLNRSIGINDDVFKRLEKYVFPGNIRELKNMAERAIILCKFNSLSVEDFPLTSRSDSPVENNTDMASLKSIEVDMIRKALLQSQFNQKAAAEILGITRDAMIRKMKKYNISIGKAEN
jgi:DNA-binding NtrC family response regulator